MLLRKPFSGGVTCNRRLIRMAAGMASGTEKEIAWPVSRVRQTFVDFFVKEQGHVEYKSSPVVPHDDPTLLFANAGMNQFKPLFLGTVDPTSPLSKLTRAVNSQKCIRAGGKHNDLEDVGKDTYHHTFFEMLGNWSFGNYFKVEAIDWAWRLLTEVYGLPAENLYATYFEGDDDVEADEEARNQWLKYLPESHVLGASKKDNFWEMGDTGPCGPCSEVHFDRIGGRDASALVNQDDPMVVEIWNLVFMQFYRDESGALSRLPDKHVDTGMGLERLVSILQDVKSNYDSDVFAPIMAAISAETGAPPYSGRLGKEDEGGRDMAYRVLSDHIRTLTFAIADGAVPSNEGRGYVLRRILRRAVRFGHEKLGAKAGFFKRLVPVVVEHFKGAFPELEARHKYVVEVIEEEEASFERTLSRGIKEFGRRAAAAKEAGQSTLSGEDAFFLYDTMGFPLDLTEIMADEAGMTVDTAGFARCMEEQRERSKRAARRSAGSRVINLDPSQIKSLETAGLAPTDDSLKYTWNIEPTARVLAIFRGGEFILDGETTVEASPSGGDEDDSESELLGVVLERTPFYYTSGGQETDLGSLRVAAPEAGLTGAEETDPDGDFSDEPSKGKLSVENVSSFGGYIVHAGSLESGSLKVGDVVRCGVNYGHRSYIAPNHTMTHALNFALRKVLGGDVDQKGSLVSSDKLRFDFSYPRAVAPDDIAKIDAIVNELISDAKPVYSKPVSLADAREIEALRAVFGETYPDPVRVVSIGQDIDPMLADPKNAAWHGYSVEFCGGTHLSNTAKAECFATVEEGSIAKGIRRVVALTRDPAKRAMDKGAEMARRVSEMASIADPKKRASTIVDLQTELDAAQIPYAQKAMLRDDLLNAAKGAAREIKAEAAKAAAAFADAALAVYGSEDAAPAAAGGGGGGASSAGVDTFATGPKFVVLATPIDMGTDPKAAQAAAAALLKTDSPRSALLLSADDRSLAASALVPASAAAPDGVDAQAWLQAALAGYDRVKVRPDKKSKGAIASANGPADEKARDTILRQAAEFASKTFN